MSKRLKRRRGILRTLFSKRKSAGHAIVVPDGYTRMGEFSEKDVFIVGYPKSGNTWFQDLVAAVVYGMMPEYCPPRAVQELIPDVHAKTIYARCGTPMYFKSHHLPRPEYRRVVYLLRDGRDAMVSYYHQMRVTQKGPVNFLRLVQAGEGLFPCKWPEHVEAWLANRFGAEFIMIRYEDLKQDTARELARFCEFVGLERDPAFLERMAKETVFEKMRDKEARLGTSGLVPWPEGTLFRRRGQVGSYKDEMGLEVLDAFLGQARDTLRRVGYEA